MKHLQAHVLLIFLSIVIFTTANGHHAMEYIEAESYSTAKLGEHIFHVHFDYMVEDRSNPQMDHWEFTPGLSRGLSDFLMFDVHTHFAKFGNDLLVPGQQAEFAPMGPSPFLEAAAFTLQYRFPQIYVVDIAVVGTYEHPFDRSKTLLNGQRVYEGALILSKDLFAHSNMVLNLRYGRDGDESYSDWIFAAKTPLSADPHGIAAGLELLGTLEDGLDNVTLLPGFYLPLGSPNTIFKSGLAFGNNMESMRMNATLMYRF
ncbi:MAG: hypothetical protein K9N46_10545 [Candidatus Marinimicrobia bacterium]|nr:hypothetical protein [Candidatus Neomarinimicrobiota bacterium]MCF7829182.1 hypothetical protein [Candidatus Neomarinimicrobiota bacterium]MCF7881165.1 hypothetical protein [Candidatus Neomarinimicrobiota bacterium]